MLMPIHTQIHKHTWIIKPLDSVPEHYSITTRTPLLPGATIGMNMSWS